MAAESTGIFDKYGRAFALIGRLPERALLLIGIADLLPSYALAWLFRQVEPVRHTIEIPPEMANGGPLTRELEMLPLGWTLTLLALVITIHTFMFGAYARFLQHDAEGKTPSVGECLFIGMARLPGALAMQLRIIGHVLAGMLLIIPGIQRYLNTRLAMPEYFLGNTPPPAINAECARLAEGWKMHILNGFATYLMILYAFSAFWPHLTRLFSGGDSFLWGFLAQTLLGLVGFSLAAVYVYCWQEARLGLKPPAFGQINNNDT